MNCVTKLLVSVLDYEHEHKELFQKMLVITT